MKIILIDYILETFQKIAKNFKIILIKQIFINFLKNNFQKNFD